MQCKNAAEATPEEQGWISPRMTRHLYSRSGLRADIILTIEIRFLKEIRDSDCVPLPELVWMLAMADIFYHV
jgi:hypothetical protein